MMNWNFRMKWIAPLLLCVSAFALPANAQDQAQAPAPAKPKPDYDMGRVQMVLLHEVPGAPADAGGKTADAHRARIKEMIDGKQLALAGPIAGQGTLRELLVFKTESAEAVREWAASLPLVKANALKPEHLTWYTARNLIKTPASPASEISYVFGLLVRGPDAATRTPDELKTIQAGHMANIGRLSELGKLVLAGPFAAGGDRRGVFVFKVDSIEEAKALCDTDPAVQAGRLAVELYKWTVPSGVLP